MAQLNIFISSTHKDLKYLRDNLKEFIADLGHFPILFEAGDVTYAPGELDESCYTEVSKADMFILIIGKRYGFPSSENKQITSPTFYDIYDSITKKEYDTAFNEAKAVVYVLVEGDTFADYNTYKLNADNKNITYANTESINTFKLIETVQFRNHPILKFNDTRTIKDWLLKQWSGLFQEMLRKLYTGIQPKQLKEEVSKLTQHFIIGDEQKFRIETFNQTTKYSEAVMKEAFDAMLKISNAQLHAQTSKQLIEWHQQLNEKIQEQNYTFSKEIEAKYFEAEKLKDERIKEIYLKHLDEEIKRFFSSQEQIMQSFSDLFTKF